jgi:hypothetical protein
VTLVCESGSLPGESTEMVSFIRERLILAQGFRGFRL